MNTEILLYLVKKDQGKYLATINPWKYPKEEPYKTQFFYQMWTLALNENSIDSFHTLSLYTPLEYYTSLVELILQYHNVDALIPVLNMKKNVKVPSKCSENCEQCEKILSEVKQWFPQLPE
jgi:hypothetical protein